MARISIRPPEYIPRLATLALWMASDRVVLGDTFAVSRQSPQTRAGIRSSAGTGRDRLWLSVPLREVTRGRTPMREAAVSTEEPWQRAHLRAISTCYRTSPYFEHYFPEVRALLEVQRHTLADYALDWTRWTMRHLGVKQKSVLASGLAESPASLLGTLDALTIGQEDEVLVLEESAAHEANRVQSAGLDVPIQVLVYDEVERRQSFEGFVPDLCALDLLMHYGPASADVVRAGTRVVPFTDWLSMGTS